MKALNSEHFKSSQYVAWLVASILWHCRYITSRLQYRATYGAAAFQCTEVSIWMEIYSRNNGRRATVCKWQPLGPRCVLCIQYVLLKEENANAPKSDNRSTIHRSPSVTSFRKTNRSKQLELRHIFKRIRHRDSSLVAGYS